MEGEKSSLGKNILGIGVEGASSLKFGFAFLLVCENLIGVFRIFAREGMGS